MCTTWVLILGSTAVHPKKSSFDTATADSAALVSAAVATAAPAAAAVPAACSAITGRTVLRMDGSPAFFTCSVAERVKNNGYF